MTTHDPDANPTAPDDLTRHLPAPGPTRVWRGLDRLVILGFILGLVAPAAMFFVGLRPPRIENRPLLTPPPISVGGLLDPAWYSSVDRYLDDNIAARGLAVRTRSIVVIKVLGGSINPAVVSGVGDWLFTIQEFTPKCDFGAADEGAQLDRAMARFTAGGQVFRFIVAPDKHAIYPDRVVPGSVATTPCSDQRRDAMRAELARRSSFAVDGWTSVLGARAADPKGPNLYYSQDTHWTPSGALPAIRDLIKSLDPSLWSDADIVRAGTKKVPQDLARQISLPTTEPTVQLRVRPGVAIVRKAVAVPVGIKNAKSVYEITASGDRPVLPGRTAIVYDSFFGLNMAALSPFFADTIWIHEGDLTDHPELGTLLGPFDRVILERVERGLYITDIDALLRPLARTGR